MKATQHRGRARPFAQPPEPPSAGGTEGASSAETIFIPEDIRGQPIPLANLSRRLAHVLEVRGLRLLGDLHGLPLDDFLKFRNFGKKSYAELLDFVISIRHRPPLPGALAAMPTPAVLADCFVVPPDIRDLNPFELPLSVRLQRVLERKGITRLGDLHGLAPIELRRYRNCGRRTIKELITLLKRAGTGEFSVAGVEFSPARCGELLRGLDEKIARLPPREQVILRLRMGGQGGRVPTLAKTGARYGLTRERVRQIVDEAVTFLRRQGGPRLMHQVRGVATLCRDSVCPLTPGLLAQWLNRQAKSLRWSLAGYVRLLGALDPQLPAWPGDQEPASHQDRLAEQVTAALEDILRTAGRGLSLKAALDGLRQRTPGRNLSATEFLAALRRARNVRVDLSKPARPVVCLSR
jgi:hypothetical protein